MDEKSRAAGAGQGRGDFAADVAGFTHAEYDDPALTVEHEIAGVNEAVINTAFELFYGLGFDHQHLAGQLFQLFGVHGGLEGGVKNGKGDRSRP
jgi:hypothetical protein